MKELHTNEFNAGNVNLKDNKLISVYNYYRIASYHTGRENHCVTYPQVAALVD